MGAPKTHFDQIIKYLKNKYFSIALEGEEYMIWDFE